LYEVQQERAVSVALAQGEIIHAEHLWGDHRRAGGTTDHPQQGVPTHREAERLAQPCPRNSPERETDSEEACCQPSCVPRPRCYNAGQSLGEDPTGTRPIAAEELADAEPPRDPLATPRQIGQRPGVTAVDMPGRGIAPRASGCHVCRRDEQRDLGVHVVEVPGMQLQRCSVGQYMGKRCSNLLEL
jgi:hypothetical protein